MNLASLNESKAAPWAQTAPTVFVVDADVAARQLLEIEIRRAGWQPIAFASAQEFLSCPRHYVPSCLILDVASSEDLDRIDQRSRDMPVIVVTGRGDVPMAVQAMKAGAADFLTKPVNGDVLIAVMQHAIESSRLALRQEERLRSLKDRHASLSQREREVMALVATGLLNKQIGGRLGISEITVKAHRGRAMQKMKAASFADLVRMASALGLNAAGTC